MTTTRTGSGRTFLTTIPNITKPKPASVTLRDDPPSKYDQLILILNPNSQGGATGNNWNENYSKVKQFLPKQHRIIFTKKAGDGTAVTRKLLKMVQSMKLPMVFLRLNKEVELLSIMLNLSCHRC
jgi:hypothetical protein